MRGGVLKLLQNGKLIQRAVYEDMKAAIVIMDLWGKLQIGEVEIAITPNDVDDNGIQIIPFEKEKKTAPLALWEREKILSRKEKPLPKITKDNRPKAEYTNISTPYGIASELHNGK